MISGVEMSYRSVLLVAGLALVTAFVAAGCAQYENPYSGPGWYLEKPRQLFQVAPRIFKGPMTYEACEIERKKIPDTTGEIYLCQRELERPGPPGL